MKVFVAHCPEPSETLAVDDFHFALDGELVTMPLQVCRNPKCGCRWSVAGLGSAKATTSFTVAELDMSFTEYVDVLRDGLRRQGWWVCPDDDVWLLDQARRHALGAAAYPVGTPLRTRDGEIFVKPRVP
jgi:hypothetical protein